MPAKCLCTPLKGTRERCWCSSCLLSLEGFPRLALALLACRFCSLCPVSAHPPRPLLACVGRHRPPPRVGRRTDKRAWRWCGALAQIVANKKTTVKFCVPDPGSLARLWEIGLPTCYLLLLPASQGWGAHQHHPRPSLTGCRSMSWVSQRVLGVAACLGCCSVSWRPRCVHHTRGTGFNDLLMHGLAVWWCADVSEAQSLHTTCPLPHLIASHTPPRADFPTTFTQLSSTTITSVPPAVNGTIANRSKSQVDCKPHLIV